MVKKESEKYIFIDTFVLSQLTREKTGYFVNWLNKGHFIIVLSSFQIVEYYNPNHIAGDRIWDIIELLIACDFVITDQKDIFQREEESYPSICKDIPILASKQSIFNRIDDNKKRFLLTQLFTSNLEKYGIQVRSWVKEYNSVKRNWNNDTNKIIANAKQDSTLGNKDMLIQNLDLRLCDNISRIKHELDNGVPVENLDRNYLRKINLVLQNKDTWRMRGIHLSSLIFWYDYIKDKKKIKCSDLGDLYHSVIIPYCKLAIVDNSKYDTCTKIQRNENAYTDIEILNKKRFTDLLDKREAD